MDLSKLNPSQLEAVTTNEGVLLVLSCAGSGKTTTITYRICTLIEKGTRPEQILALTFTRKAANEMMERLVKLIGAPGRNVQMGTFHSLCSRFLRENATLLTTHTPTFTIYDDGRQKTVAKMVLVDTPDIDPQYFLAEVSRWKRHCLWKTMDEHFRDPQGRVVSVMISLVEQYQRALIKDNAMDFDDLIIEFIRLLRRNPEVAAKYRERFRHILVDEFQDTDRVQMELIRLLTKNPEGDFVASSLCCVGDDDQTIYSWRGATIENLIHFERDFPTTRIVKMQDNYRSTQNIVLAAASVIQKNNYRRDKTIRTDKIGGEPVKVVICQNPELEAAYVMSKVRECLRDFDYRDIAVLYRTNAQSEPIEKALMVNRIPYQIKGGMSFYERKEVKDMLSYIELFVNPKSDVAFTRICNVPARKMADGVLSKLKAQADASGQSLLDACAHYPGSPNDFLRMLHGVQAQAGGDYSQLYQLLLERSGYMAYARRLDQKGETPSEYRVNNLNQLGVRIEKFFNDNPDKNLGDFLTDVQLMSRVDTEEEEDNKVTLSTVHGAKGLEWPVTIVIGCEDGLFPHKNSLHQERTLEEERRLFYVAMTRAKEHLYITFCRQRYDFSKRSDVSGTPSRFVRDDLLGAPGNERYTKLLKAT